MIRKLIKKHPFLTIAILAFIFLFVQCKYERYADSEPYRPLIKKYFDNKATPASEVVKDLFPNVDQDEFSIICTDYGYRDDRFIPLLGGHSIQSYQNDFPSDVKKSNDFIGDIKFDFSHRSPWYPPYYIFVTDIEHKKYHVLSMNWEALAPNIGYPKYIISNYDFIHKKVSVLGTSSKRCHPIKKAFFIAQDQNFGFAKDIKEKQL